MSNAPGSRFDDEHVVVTGGSAGIGVAIARRFVSLGARVTIAGRDESKLADAAQAIGASPMVCDVTDEAAVTRQFAAVAEANGPIGILINNAGAASATPFAKMQSEHWHAMLAVNLTGPWLCTKAVVGGMLEARRGRIVNIASTAALKGYAYVSAYCAAKHGVLGLTRSLALEFANRGITVNAVCPGYTDTDLVQRSLDKIVASTGRSRDEALAELTKVNPQGRLISPDEVADTVVWLCGEHAASITGQAIAIAGGEVM